MQGAGDDPPLGFQLQAASSQPVQPGVLEDSPGEAVSGNAKTARWFPETHMVGPPKGSLAVS